MRRVPPLVPGVMRNGNAQRAAVLDKEIIGAFERALEVRARAHQGEEQAAGVIGLARARGELRKGALRALQIGGAHGRKQAAFEFFRREGDRQPQDRAAHAMVAQNLPEGLALAAQLGGGPVERDAVAADLPETLRPADARGGQLRQVGFQIAVEEVENVVPRRADAGGEGGPCHGGKRRESGAQARETALLLQAGQVRELAFRHEALGEAGIQAIEPQENELADAGFAVAAPPCGRAPQHAERPDQQRYAAQEQRHHDGEERAEEGEARPWSYIGKREYHRSFPSTRNTSKTLSCRIGPWPK